MNRPYVEIISERHDKNDGFELELDWNDNFINQLAKNGIDGDTDEDMVQLWLESIRRSQDAEFYEEELMNIAKEETLRNSREENDL